MKKNFAEKQPQPLVEFKNVYFSYKNAPKLLNNVSFQLFDEDKIGIIGHNGSGKSTIANLLLGIRIPNKGEIKLFGEKVLWSKHYPSLGYIGDPSHNPEELGLPIGNTVNEVIHIFESLSSKEDKELRQQLKDQLKINNFSKRNIRDLSKGERVRLMAFLAIGKKIKLLVADEATEGLDDEGEKALLQIVQEAFVKQKFGIIWISHKHCQINFLTNKIYHLNGTLREKGFENFSCKYSR